MDPSAPRSARAARRRARLLDAAGLALVIGGAAALVAWASPQSGASLSPAASGVTAAPVVGAADVAPPSPGPHAGALADRIRIGRLGIDAPIVEGDGVNVPLAAAAHYPGTAWPGSGSNIYLYAHAREGLFRELWRIRTDDLVELDLVDGGSASYRVSEILPLVAWDALEYLDPTPVEQVTLQTCLGYEETSPRFVVIAQRSATAA
jgi:sortase A